MYQKLPVNGFKWKRDISMFNEEFIKSYHQISNEGHVLKIDVKYPKYLHDLHSDLTFLPERIKIYKCNKFVYNLYDRKNYVVHTRALKQTLNHELVFKKCIE